MENTDSPTQGLSQLCDSGKQNVNDEFIHLIPRNTIQGLKDCKEVSLYFFYLNLIKSIMYALTAEPLFCFQENTFVVLATIKHIVAVYLD